MDTHFESGSMTYVGTIRLGGRELIGPVTTVKTSFNEQTDVPIATFNFKYRSEGEFDSSEIS